jgi:lipoprotein-releasing system permease protein
MYKFLLCFRYLSTRWIGLVSVISVMLGVGTMIVVNSVMFGFRTQMQSRMHGILADVMVGGPDIYGFEDYQDIMKAIEAECGDKIQAMTPVMESWGLITYDFGGAQRTRPVTIVGVDPAGRAAVGEFRQHLLHAGNRERPELKLREDAIAWQAEHPDRLMKKDRPEDAWPAAFVGYQIATTRIPGDKDRADHAILPPGSEFVLQTIIRSKKAEPIAQRYTVADWFRCDMSEYDANMVFVPLEHFQELRNCEGRATSLQIKLRDYADAPAVVGKIQRMLGMGFEVVTWEDKQSVLLQAVKVEAWILNFILFFIIAVAGFGILAIFFMIVVEKTRDIGVLKALGASDGGVMSIFLAYAFVLGMIGCGVGATIGIAFTLNINPIERWLSDKTGFEVFPRDIYYFKEIPAVLDPLTVLWVSCGALLIAVSAAVLPARRAARLKPVEALRHV